MAARPQKLTEQEVQERLQGLQGWAVTEGMLRKQFRFTTFMAGIVFVNQIAAVAEAMDHHPDIYIRFGLITVALVTHSARGLTALDFEQAARLEALA
jgi:4a-hydroxytetrahydrobiopterin dehydratase